VSRSPTVRQPEPEWLRDILDTLPPIVHITDAARLLHCSDRHLRRLAASGRLVSLRDGPRSGQSPAKLCFPRKEIGRFLLEIANR